MPVEVRELIIKATVVPEKESTGAASGGSTDNNVSPTEQLISTCVEKVLEILKDKDGR
jgi:hypothetical protein